MLHAQATVVALVVAVAVMTGSSPASAQDARPWTAGVDFTALGLDRASREGTGVPGVALRVDWALTRRLDVEAKAAWFPSRALQEFQAQGGRTVQVAAGLRGTFLTARHAALYGVLLPQVLYVTNTVTAGNGPAPITGGLTHFALDTGLGLEVAAGPRWAIRAELTGPLYFTRGGELARSAPSPTTGAVLIASIAPRAVNPWQVSAGLSYRMGQLRREGQEAPVAGRWEVGAQLTSGTTAGVFAVPLRTAPAFGGFASYRVAPAVYVDAGLNVFTEPSRRHTPYDGGYLTQVLGGVKIGPRLDHYGFFIKARAGVDSHSAALSAFDATGLAVRRHNLPAVDVGGVIERYVGRWLLIRLDGGDALSVIRPTTIEVDGGPHVQPGQPATHTLQLAAGVGWRF